MQRKIDNMPSFIEYLSYVFFCCSCIVGPVFEFDDFKNFMELTGNYKDMPRGTQSYVTIIPALKQLGGGLICIGAHVVLTVLGIDTYFCGSKEYTEYGNWFSRVGYYYVANTSQRLMYYSPMLFNDAATVACGLAYSGTKVDSEEITYGWDRVVSVYVIALETSSSPVKIAAYWNHSVHLWLKHYVQNRIVPAGQKVQLWHTCATNMVSAFWHGFYPSFYIMFLMLGIFVELSKDVYRSRILFDWIPYPNFVADLVVMLIGNYLGVSFNQLTFE